MVSGISAFKLYKFIDMEIIELNMGFQINVGSPEPIIISNDNELFIAFYVDKQKAVSESQEQNSDNNTEVFIMRFKSFLKYTFGMPNNETIQGHPYSILGMESFAFYELKNSDLIEQLEDIDKIHPYYNSEKWKEYKHYILTFHDNMFECVAKKYETMEHRQVFNLHSRYQRKISK